MGTSSQLETSEGTTVESQYCNSGCGQLHGQNLILIRHFSHSFIYRHYVPTSTSIQNFLLSELAKNRLSYTTFIYMHIGGKEMLQCTVCDRRVITI